MSRTAVASVVTGALVLVAVAGGASPARVPHPSDGFARPAGERARHLGGTVGERGRLRRRPAAWCRRRGRHGGTRLEHLRRVRRPRAPPSTSCTPLAPNGPTSTTSPPAWAQECTGCTQSTALSVQVVVVRGAPTVAPNNRALSLTPPPAQGCRTVRGWPSRWCWWADPTPPPLSDEAPPVCRAWFDEQATALRASVVMPDPPSPTPSASPTADPTSSPTLPPQPLERSARAARRDAASALDGLTALLADALDAEPVSADVEVGR